MSPFLVMLLTFFTQRVLKWKLGTQSTLHAHSLHASTRELEGHLGTQTLEKHLGTQAIVYSDTQRALGHSWTQALGHWRPSRDFKICR